MKRRILCLVITGLLLGAAGIWATTGTASKQAADIKAPHAGHAQADGISRPDFEDGHQHVETEDHGIPDDHEGHGPEEEASAHEGHDHGVPGGLCPEHRVPEEQDALCHGDNITRLQPGEGMMVRLESVDAAARAGLSTDQPKAVALAQGTAVPGRVAFNRNRLAVISPMAGGVVRKVYVQPGARVEKGQSLADVDMPEMAALKAGFFAARAKRAQTEATYLREKDLLSRGITSRQEFQMAESEYRAAVSASEQHRQQLMNYGLSPDSIRKMLATGDRSALVPVRAPFSGTLVDVKTALGEMVAPGTPLFTLADLDVLWIEVFFPESRIHQARPDAPIQAAFTGLPGRVFTGRIFQVGAAVDEQTRTLRALAEVENPDHHLRVGIFGQVHLLEEDRGDGLAIAADALQSIDGLSFVFVRREPDLFELRRVQAGEKKDGLVPILAGLAPEEPVVATQGFALKSEVLKARLGASCADH